MRVRESASRLMWFVGLWAGGVLSVGAVSYLIRWAIVK